MTKYTCIRKCYWKEILWEVGDTYVAQVADEAVPAHFVADAPVEAPPVEPKPAEAPKKGRKAKTVEDDFLG